MGVLNCTPDSFADGGQYNTLKSALNYAHYMIGNGADIIDIGGESSRPNADLVSLDEELKHTIPIIEAIRKISDIPLSIDTTKPEVMQSALNAGANIINDISALGNPKSLEVAKKSHCKICLMHMQGTPQTMQNNPKYNDVVSEVYQFLKHKIKECTQANIDKNRLIIDVGFGFGKTFAHNLSLLNHLKKFTALGVPILAGLSKKSMIDAMLGGNTTPDERIIGSLVAHLRAVENGASIIRTHNVIETKQALSVWLFK